MRVGYDVFISYKSENSGPARAVAEALIASGLQVWFAEFHILLANYDKFQQEIDRAIDASQHALLFTNVEWAKSKYCQLEIARILQRIPSHMIFQIHIPRADEPQHLMRWVLERLMNFGADGRSIDGDLTWVAPETHSVQVPREQWPARDAVDLSHVQSHSWCDLDHALQWLKCDTQLLGKHELFVPQQMQTNGPRWTEGRYGVSLLAEPFEQRINPDSQLFTSRDIVGFFGGALDSHQARMGVQVNPYETVVAGLTLPPGKENDDRALYGVYRRYALEWIRNLADGRDVGLHLFYLRNDHGRRDSHLAITYRYRSPDESGEVWERRYSIRVQHPVTDDKGEIDISFKLQFDQENNEENLRTFCRYGRLFESIASSVQYNPPARYGEVALNAICVRLLMLIGAAALLVTAAKADSTGWLTPIAACVTGMLAADLAVLALWGKAMRTWLGIGTPTVRLNRPMEAYERHCGLSYDHFWQSIIWSLQVAGRGAVDWFSTVPIAAGIFFGVQALWYWLLVGAFISLRGNANFVRTIREKNIRLRDAARPVSGAPAVSSSPDGKQSSPEAHGGIPRLRLVALAEISPHLSSLIAELRGNDRGFLPTLVRPWFAGLLFAGSLGASGHVTWGAAVAVIMLVLVGLAVLVVRKVARPPLIVEKLRQLNRSPTTQIVQELATVYLHLGDDGGKVGYLSRSVQWSALWCQLEPKSVRPLHLLGWSALSLAQALSLRPQFFRDTLVHSAVQSAHDALEEAQRCATTPNDLALCEELRIALKCWHEYNGAVQKSRTRS